MFQEQRILLWNPVRSVSVQKVFLCTHNHPQTQNCPRNLSKGSRKPLCGHKNKISQSFENHPALFPQLPLYFIFFHTTNASQSCSQLLQQGSFISCPWQLYFFYAFDCKLQGDAIFRNCLYKFPFHLNPILGLNNKGGVHMRMKNNHLP